jgi:hypothetical protein
MIVVVTGGRRCKDERFVNHCLTSFHIDRGITEMVNGMAREGVDKFCYEWALRHGIPVRQFPADWDSYGEAAGPIRNQEMLDQNPDIEVGLVFPGNSGTNDMTRRLRKAGIERVFFDVPLTIAEQLAKWG